MKLIMAVLKFELAKLYNIGFKTHRNSVRLPENVKQIQKSVDNVDKQPGLFKNPITIAKLVTTNNEEEVVDNTVITSRKAIR